MNILPNSDSRLGKKISAAFIVAGCLVVPTLAPALLGWVSALVPAPAFYYLRIFGAKAGFRILGGAVALAASIAMATGTLPFYTLFLTFLILPLVWQHAANAGYSGVRAGVHGFVALVFLWSMMWGIFSFRSGSNLQSIVNTIVQQSLDQTLQIYRQASKLPPDVLVTLENGVQQLRTILPAIFPGIFAAGTILVVWMNLVLSNWLLAAHSTATGSLWPLFRHWRLAEWFVWSFIVGAAGYLLLPSPADMAAMNLLLSSMAVFFLQGLALLVFFLHKTGLPASLRVLIYGLITIQTYGILFIICVGIADIWGNFRRHFPEKSQTETV